jgi:hypothetical protein
VTRRDLVELLEANGWRVERTGHAPLTPVGRLAARLTGGRSAEFLVYQWSALARRVALESGSVDTESGSTLS